MVCYKLLCSCYRKLIVEFFIDFYNFVLSYVYFFLFCVCLISILIVYEKEEFGYVFLNL